MTMTVGDTTGVPCLHTRRLSWEGALDLVAGRFVDFYALLSVPSDAPLDTVREAIVAQRRVWEPRRDDPGEAERDAVGERVRAIDLAEVVLLDPEQRADYDEEWHGRQNGSANGAAAAAVHAEAPAAPADARSDPAPVRVQSELLTLEPQRSNGTPSTTSAEVDAAAEPARTALRAGDTARAIDAFHYAILRHPHDPALHFELGQAYVQAENHTQAIGAFESAARLAPHVPEYRAAVGDALVHLGRPGEAIAVLEQVVAEAPRVPYHRAALAQALHDTCVHEMTSLKDGLVCLTTADQARLVDRLTGRALSLLDPDDQSQLAQDIREKHELARLAVQRAWRPPLPWWLMASFAVVIATGFALLIAWWVGLVALAVLAAVAFLLGLQPTWWHVARAAREADAIAEP
ncbi:MAG: tetratricopeptide repeat protein [Streptosporangiales bacterium]|nr:tetratricopeptide repeat protein [Streptosporangiales bacterium]